MSRLTTFTVLFVTLGLMALTHSALAQALPV